MQRVFPEPRCTKQRAQPADGMRKGTSSSSGFVYYSNPSAAEAGDAVPAGTAAAGSSDSAGYSADSTEPSTFTFAWLEQSRSEAGGTCPGWPEGTFIPPLFAGAGQQQQQLQQQRQADSGAKPHVWWQAQQDAKAGVWVANPAWEDRHEAGQAAGEAASLLKQQQQGGDTGDAATDRGGRFEKHRVPADDSQQRRAGSGSAGSGSFRAAKPRAGQAAAPTRSQALRDSVRRCRF